MIGPQRSLPRFSDKSSVFPAAAVQPFNRKQSISLNPPIPKVTNYAELSRYSAVGVKAALPSGWLSTKDVANHEPRFSFFSPARTIEINQTPLLSVNQYGKSLENSSSLQISRRLTGHRQTAPWHQRRRRKPNWPQA